MSTDKFYSLLDRWDFEEGIYQKEFDISLGQIHRIAMKETSEKLVDTYRDMVFKNIPRHAKWTKVLLFFDETKFVDLNINHSIPLHLFKSTNIKIKVTIDFSKLTNHGREDIIDLCLKECFNPITRHNEDEWYDLMVFFESSQLHAIKRFIKIDDKTTQDIPFSKILEQIKNISPLCKTHLEAFNIYPLLDIYFEKKFKNFITYFTVKDLHE